MKRLKVQLLLDKLISKLELTQNNLDFKLQEVQKYILKEPDFKNSYTTNSDVEKLLIELETFLKEDFINLAKFLAARFIQTNSELNFFNQIQAWLTKDFLNADRLYLREFRQSIKKEKYLQIKKDFLCSLVDIKTAKRTKENSLFKLNLNKKLALIQDFEQGFYLAPNNSAKEVLQAKYKLLIEHTQINPEEVFYLSLCTNSNSKRHFVFTEYAISCIKRQIYQNNFFKTFKLEVNRFFNLATLIYKGNRSFFALDSTLCFYLVEKLVADFLFLYNIDYKKFCALSKPENYPNFYVKYGAISIFINSEFELCFKNNLTQKLVYFHKMITKTQAYELLEEAFTELGLDCGKLKPLSPDELWSKTAKFLEDVFSYHLAQVLTILWRENISLKSLSTHIEKNLAKIYSTNSLIFLLKNAYEQVLQKYTSDFEKDSTLNILDFYFTNKADNFILIDAKYNSDFNYQKKLAAISASNRLFALSYSGLSIGVLDSFNKKSHLQKKDLKFLHTNSLLEFFALEAVELEKNQLKNYAKDFFIAKLAKIIAIIFAKKSVNQANKIGVFVATKMQKDFLRKSLKKFLAQENLKRIEIFYSYSNLDNIKSKKLNYALLIDLYFCAKFLTINSENISMVLFDINSEILSATKDLYKNFLSFELGFKKAIVFSHKKHTDLLLS